MPAKFLTTIKGAVTNLNPEGVRETARRPIHIGLVASHSAAYAAMEDYFLPPELSRERRLESIEYLHRASDPGAPSKVDLEIFEEGLHHPSDAFVFHFDAPERTVRSILDRRPELGLPLARRYPPFRQPVVEHIIRTVARENALFSLATALPDIIPSLIEIPWALGEFASDTAFLTMNQIRMGFLLAAASDRDVGYREQRGEVGSIVAGAFGWRALARELAGKIPMGGGLIPKAAIAYAGTYVTGLSLERYYRIGYAYTRLERREAYHDALERGKAVAGNLLESMKIRRNPA